MKKARLIKSRSDAQETLRGHKVFLNGLPAKPGKQLNTGDIIELHYTSYRLKIRVLELPTGNISRDRAASLYQIIDKIPTGDV
ncbi:MAG: hypothetical protein JW801_00080 [Bacteroidales bacterium]|nr:hypothetical protein [Bacteroidales bacterium]